ncbi:MAG: hypothetical protein HY812_16925 [Planctomycetes bacterium]|nr:hypothetical protein [Planctomycetota bacterium]
MHFFPHIGYVGFVWNARYLQMIDAILGIAMIDICGDDGYPVGEWSFPYRTGSAEPEEDASWEEEEVEEEDEVEEPVSDEDAELEELLESLERQRKELEAGKRR